MKKEVILLFLVLISGILFFASLFNFKNPINIPGNVEDNFFVMSVGVDKSTDENNKFRLTIVGQKFSSDTSQSGSSSDGKESETVTVEGNTIYETVRNFALYKRNSIFWGHIKYILISEDVAKDNIVDILDFFIRDHELRFDTSVVIVRDTSAESFIRTGEQIGIFIVDLLKGVFDNVGKLSISSDVKLAEVMKTYNNIYCDAYLPAISIVSREDDEINPKYPDDAQNPERGGGKLVGTSLEEDKKSQSGGQSQGEVTPEDQGSILSGGNSGSQNSDSSSKSKNTLYVNLDGYAVFDGTKLLGYVTNKVSRGLNWVNSKIVSSVLIVKNMKDDKPISMEVISSNSKTKVTMNDDKPEATVEIDFSTNTAEVMTQEDPFNEEGIKNLNKQQDEIVKSEVESIIKYAQENGVDILGLNDVIYHKYPLKWEKIQDNWDEVFRNMKISVEVKSNINRTYHIRQPIRSNPGGK